MDQGIAAQHGIAWGERVIDQVPDLKSPVWARVALTVLLDQRRDNIDTNVRIQIDFNMLAPVTVAAWRIDESADAQPGQDGRQFAPQHLGSFQRRTWAGAGLRILP